MSTIKYINMSNELWYFLTISVALPYFLRTIQCFLKIDFLNHLFCCFTASRRCESDNELLSEESVEETEAERTIQHFLMRNVHSHGEKINRLDYMWYYYVLDSSHNLGYRDTVEPYQQQCTWVEARVACRWSPNFAIFVGAVRFIFFHLLQPMAFITAAVIILPQADYGQQICVSQVILFREAFCVISIVMAVFVKPSFLLVNMSPTTGNLLDYDQTDVRLAKLFNKWSYITCPCRLVVNVAWGDNFIIQTFFWLGIIASDISAFVSIGFATAYHDLPLPLLIHIASIVLSWLGLLPLWIWVGVNERGNVLPGGDAKDLDLEWHEMQQKADEAEQGEAMLGNVAEQEL